MPNLLSVLACEKVILSTDGQLSLINIINGITTAVPADEELNQTVGNSADWYVVTLWLASQDEANNRYKQKLQLINPDGTTEERFSEFTFDVNKKGMFTKFETFPIAERGVLSVNVYLQHVDSNAEWQHYNSYVVNIASRYLVEQDGS